MTSRLICLLSFVLTLYPAVDVRADDGPIRSSARVEFSHSHDGWKGSGVRVAVGDHVTLLGEGNVAMGLPVALPPNAYLWLRIGPAGRAFNPPTDAHSFTADRAGEVFVAVRPAGVYWSDESGTFPKGFEGVPDYPLSARADILVWQGTAAEGLEALARTGEERFVVALENLGSGPALPAGFEYLWNLGESQVFESFAADDRSGIRALPLRSAGIVKKALDIPLTESTRIDFEWLYRNLPALGPESEPQFHDYLSIAIEFDNGQDLTWFWSGHLEAGTSFTCPLPWWDQRETHMVLQHGPEGLGAWHEHSRTIAEDYRNAVGGPLPARIVGVWFINAGLFGGPGGEALFANVTVHDMGERVEVFR